MVGRMTRQKGIDLVAGAADALARAPARVLGTGERRAPSARCAPRPGPSGKDAARVGFDERCT